MKVEGAISGSAGSFDESMALNASRALAKDGQPEKALEYVESAGYLGERVVNAVLNRATKSKDRHLARRALERMRGLGMEPMEFTLVEMLKLEGRLQSAGDVEGVWRSRNRLADGPFSQSARVLAHAEKDDARSAGRALSEFLASGAGPIRVGTRARFAC